MICLNSYLISVAIPTYNRADYLKETLDSILNQTYPASEIIVVDDGSTDHTPAVLDSYGKQIKSIRIDNSGAGIARKTAVEASTCPWVAFCDSDDIWLPQHLERRIFLLKQYPEVDFSFSDLLPFGLTAQAGRTYFTDAPDGWWTQFPNPDENNCIQMGNKAYLPFLEYNPGSPVTTLMTRDLYNRIGGIDGRYSRMVAEDADMARKSVLHGNVLCDLTATAKQRRHPGNMSAQALNNLLGKCQILEDHISLKIAPEPFRENIQAEINSTLHEAFLAAYYANDFTAAQHIIARINWRSLSTKNKLRFIKLFISSLSNV